ncbi:MAG: 2-oxo acid dehydrogenase subunit E2 [Bacteroidetes bacterium]|nr:2-oxo acid dehydrogenase subunit E2 [Bacteroidota bacterium]
MALYELVLPKMGESVAEATIIKWVKKPGDQVDVDDTVLEIATDKVDSEVPSPVSGRINQVFFREDEVVQVGAVLATIETGEHEILIEKSDFEHLSEPELDLSAKEKNSQETATLTEEKKSEEGIKSADLPNSTRFYSPLVKSMAAEEGITMAELDTILGTGSEGRVTKKDIIDYINSGSDTHSRVNMKEFPPSPPTIDTNPENRLRAGSFSGGTEIIEMERMRKLISDHMVMSIQTSAHVTSFVEADVTNLVQWRDRIKNSFEIREGEKITFTPIFIEAISKAIKDLPMINISVDGSKIIKKHDINIGMAAALPNGNLIVPVIKNADQLSLFGLTKVVNDLASRARLSKLKPDETQGGTFTMTNLGSFGNIMGTPIINQPQVAILAVGAIKKKPAVLETEFGDVIAIRHMMFLSLSYDHRVVDGALGGSFVRKVADYLESWDVNRII